MAYKESELVLQVSRNVNPQVWDEGFYQNFMALLFGNREYQIEATETALRFMNSGEYQDISALADENFQHNDVIKERWNDNFDAMKNDLDLPDKLAATIDLATGTGKSYVMIAIALIMLASKKIKRVLVLVPSITIESELTQKFREVIANDQLIKALGSDFIAPEILNGDSTIVENAIAIENRNAIYSAQANRNSIIDSLKDNGETTLVLNDEVHHVYYSESNEWKKFIQDDAKNEIEFKYVIGFTGTPYKSRTKSGAANEYFSDVIYRYSLRNAIEQNFVKNIEYISKEDIPNDKNERWQVILNSHNQIAEKLRPTLGEKPITIIVTANTSRADSQAKSFKTFLQKQRGLSDDEVDALVLSVHSKNSAAADRLKLKAVDEHDNPVEFIFSVSMLTEGWDVKRVFQIVPDAERAFNSRLLISQVLGRGLRRPSNWQIEWGTPTVTVFNHEKWSTNIKALVEDILELRKTITIRVNPDSEYNFVLTNIKYQTEAKSESYMKMGSYNLWENGVTLPTDTEIGTSTINVSAIQHATQRTILLDYAHDVFTVEQIAALLYTRFEDLPDPELTREYQSIWTINKIEIMIRDSLSKSGNTVITKKIKNALLSSMNTIFRQGSKSVSYDIRPDIFVEVRTGKLPNETSDLTAFHRNRTLFYSDDFPTSLSDDASQASFKELSDSMNGYKQLCVSNKYHFKTPQYGVTVSGYPETEFMKRLVTDEIAKRIDGFIKSADMNFYNFEYVWQKGSHHQNGNFNPDWFIKQGSTYVVVETKDDSQIADPDLENIGKNKAALEHFRLLNEHFAQEESKVQYKFIFLTPRNYDLFFTKLKSHDIVNFTSDLDYSLRTKF